MISQLKCFQLRFSPNLFPNEDPPAMYIFNHSKTAVPNPCNLVAQGGRGEPGPTSSGLACTHTCSSICVSSGLVHTYICTQLDLRKLSCTQLCPCTSPLLAQVKLCAYVCAQACCSHGPVPIRTWLSSGPWPRDSGPLLQEMERLSSGETG